jgi:hypothetical protein
MPEAGKPFALSSCRESGYSFSRSKRIGRFARLSRRRSDVLRFALVVLARE